MWHLKCQKKSTDTTNRKISDLQLSEKDISTIFVPFIRKWEES